MKKIILVAALICLIIEHVKADLRTDLQKSGLTNIGQDFYVIFVNPNISSVTNGCVIYTLYNAIQKESKAKEVVFVFKKEGYNQKYFVRYMTEVIKIPNFPSKKAKICINDNIYNGYKKYGWYSELIYYSDRIQYQAPAKFADFHKFQNFPVAKIKIDYINAVTLDTNFLHTRRDQFCQFRNKLVQISDDNYRTGILDSTGILSNYFIWDTLVLALELYKKYRNPSASEKETAIKHDNYKATNRPVINPLGIFSTKDHIYVPFTIGIVERSKKNYFSSGGGKFKKEIKEGDLEGNLYAFIMKFDSTLKKHELIDLNKPVFDEMFHHFDLGIEQVYSPNDTDFYMCHEYAEDFRDEIYNKNIMSKFKLENNELKFEKFVNIAPDTASTSVAVTNFFTKFQDDIFLCRTASNEIYSIKNEKKVAELSGLPEHKNIKETYPKYIDDSTRYNLAFEVLAVKNINDNYFAVVYKNFRRVVIEVFNNKMESVQLLNAPIADDNQVGGYAIYNDYLEQLQFTNGKAYLLQFKFSQN